MSRIFSSPGFAARHSNIRPAQGPGHGAEILEGQSLRRVFHECEPVEERGAEHGANVGGLAVAGREYSENSSIVFGPNLEQETRRFCQEHSVVRRRRELLQPFRQLSSSLW